MEVNIFLPSGTWRRTATQSAGMYLNNLDTGANGKVGKLAVSSRPQVGGGEARTNSHDS